MMHKLPPRRSVLAATLAGLVAGCATKSPEKPIVLRRPPPNRRPLPTPPPRSQPVKNPDPTPAPPTELTPEQKAALFQDFDRYLSRPDARP